ncbi:3-beta hydroxysteroid dehydrogenase [Sphingobacteriaceae bacterium]|nr:3-beta hydroxysteroid dehydrogenase [Sphingobacteriaceae bacterium]
MKVFVTGATGFVGSAVVKELLSAGHEVLSLARSEESAKALLEMGAKVHRGSLDDLESLRKGAASADGVIHTGFNHNFSRFKESCEEDRDIIAALGSALIGSERPLIVTSGTGVLPVLGRVAIEEDSVAASVNPRKASEEASDALAEKGVRVSIMRLPPSVHGKGDHGFVPMLINIAREKGVSVYKGEGGNLWPSVHRFDAACLYRLALEKSPAAGTRIHAVAEEGIAFRTIATAIAKGLNIPVASKSPEDAATHFGGFAHFAAMDCAASGKHTQEFFNWHPIQTRLIEDVESNYFQM